MNKGAICIIPARGGSRRIPKKNIREFHGKPIIWYSLKAAHDSGLFKHVIVSTDDDEIADAVRGMTSIPTSVLRRDPLMAQDHVGTQLVVAHVIDQVRPRYDTPVCCLYATAPMVSVADMDLGRELMMKNQAWCLSVGTEPLADAGQWYWGRAEWYKTRRPLLSFSTRIVPIASKRVCDINTEEDWQRALQMYAALQVNMSGG